MAEPLTPKPADAKPADGKPEVRREAVSTTMSDKSQDGRGINPATGKLNAGVDQVTFVGTMTKLDADGHPVLTDRLTGTQQLTFTPNPDDIDTFRW